MTNGKIFVIYHGNCDDGFAAAWCIRHALGEDRVEFYPGVYQAPPPDVAGRDVILVDFSYKRPVIDEMRKSANSILILDHHKTAEADLSEYAAEMEEPWRTRFGELAADYKVRTEAQKIEWNTCPIGVLFDMNRSGAGIAWDFFHPDEARPPFINYIEDRDLWRKKLQGGNEFIIALRSYPQDFATWDLLVNEVGAGGLIAKGGDIQRYYRIQIEAMKKEAYPAIMNGHEILISNSPYFAASEIAGELAEGKPFGASFFQRADGKFQYSLRSRDGGVDVSEVAKMFGGGGHRNAAGFATDGTIHLRA